MLCFLSFGSGLFPFGFSHDRNRRCLFNSLLRYDDLFDRLIDPTLLIRRLYIVANHIIPEDTALQKKDRFTQLDLFTDYAAEEQKQKANAADLERERKLQEAMLSIRKKFGKNAVLKAMNLEEGATAKDRNNQIGGHKA